MYQILTKLNDAFCPQGALKLGKILNMSMSVHIYIKFYEHLLNISHVLGSRLGTGHKNGIILCPNVWAHGLEWGTGRDKADNHDLSKFRTDAVKCCCPGSHKQKHKVQSYCDWRVLERLCGGGSVWSRSQGNGWIFRQNSGPLFWISSQALVERLYHSLSFIFYCCPVDFVIHLPTQPLVYFLGSSLGQGIALTKESWSLLEKKERIFTFMILF